MRFKTRLLTIVFLGVIISCDSSVKTDDTSNDTNVISRPNIIFVFADDWGYGDVGVHGSTFCETPNIDKMATEGIDFQNASVVNPVCSPSRVGVMTGHFPARYSVHGHFASVESHIKRNMPDWMPPDAPMLPRMLKNAGYKTAHFGKWHLSNTHVQDAPTPLEYGYDEYGAFNLPGRLHQMNADSTLYKTIDFIKRNKDQPFFVNAWLHATHTPHYPKDNYMEQFAHLDEQKQVYAAVVAEYDARIGELFATLKDLGIDDNTLVIFSSDNGPEITGTQMEIEDASTGPGMGTYYSVGEKMNLKGKKRSLFAGGVRVPFIVRWPAVIKTNRVDRATEITTVDLLPTFLEIAEVALPEGYQPDGESLYAAFKGESFQRTKPVFWNWHFSSSRPDFWPSAGMQQGNWKLLTNHETSRVELYDLSQDWAEQQDLASENPVRIERMLEEIQKFEASLPTSPPSGTFSEERGLLQQSVSE